MPVVGRGQIDLTLKRTEGVQINIYQATISNRAIEMGLEQLKRSLDEKASASHTASVMKVSVLPFIGVSHPLHG